METQWLDQTEREAWLRLIAVVELCERFTYYG